MTQIIGVPNKAIAGVLLNPKTYNQLKKSVKTDPETENLVNGIMFYVVEGLSDELFIYYDRDQMLAALARATETAPQDAETD